MSLARLQDLVRAPRLEPAKLVVSALPTYGILAATERGHGAVRFNYPLFETTAEATASSPLNLRGW